jgi:sialidase-1
MDLVNEKDIYYLRVITSSDNGKSWSCPRDITTEITPPEWHNDFKFITSGRGIQTRSGNLLHTLVNLEKGLFLFGSDNHGESWYWMDAPVHPADESKIAELADGTWMINSRVNGAGVRFVHTSADEGKTWVSKPDSVWLIRDAMPALSGTLRLKTGLTKTGSFFPTQTIKITVKI